MACRSRLALSAWIFRTSSSILWISVCSFFNSACLIASSISGVSAIYSYRIAGHVNNRSSWYVAFNAGESKYQAAKCITRNQQVQAPGHRLSRALHNFADTHQNAHPQLLTQDLDFQKITELGPFQGKQFMTLLKVRDLIELPEIFWTFARLIKSLPITLVETSMLEAAYYVCQEGGRSDAL